VKKSFKLVGTLLCAPAGSKAHHTALHDAAAAAAAQTAKVFSDTLLWYKVTAIQKAC
jgi:hypothetical protein